MLTARSLYDTLISLVKDIDSYRWGTMGLSLGYIPFLLHAKWEQDNGKEKGLDFSSPTVIHQLRMKYRNYAIGDFLKKIHEEYNDNKIPEGPSDVVMAYAIKTINSLNLSEKNLEDRSLSKAFNAYLARATDFGVNRFDYNPRRDAVKLVTELVIRNIAGEIDEAYDPFCSDGYALRLINTKEVRGAEGNSIKARVAKIRMDFLGKNADIKSVPAGERPELTPEGKLKTYPFIISCLNDIDFRNGRRIVTQDIYNRYNKTVHPDEREYDEEDDGSKRYTFNHPDYSLGIVLGHALAVTGDRCILFSNSTRNFIDIFETMDSSQKKAFLSSDVLESVITINRKEDEKTGDGLSTIYIFNKKKDEKHRGKVFFLNAVASNHTIADEIVRIYREAEEVEGISRFVPFTEIEETSRICLYPPGYILTPKVQDTGNILSHLQSLRRIDEQLTSLSGDLIRAGEQLTLKTP